MVLFSFSSAMGEQTTISFKRVNTSGGDYTYDPNDPELGNRLPPRNITGYIDWESRSIILPDEILEEIISYEIWADNICISSTSDADSFMSNLSISNNSYLTIILTTQNYILIGSYISSSEGITVLYNL